MSTSENPFGSPNSPAAPKAATQKSAGSDKPPAWAHILCGWPLLMIFVGGMIGGGLGGAAYGISISLFKTSLPMPVKIVLPILIGLAAIGLYFAIIIAFVGLARPA